MIRRVLLATALAAAPLLSQTPPAHATDFCLLTVYVDNQQVLQQPRCFDWGGGVLCETPGAELLIVTVDVRVCVPRPVQVP